MVTGREHPTWSCHCRDSHPVWVQKHHGYCGLKLAMSKWGTWEKKLLLTVMVSGHWVLEQNDPVIWWCGKAKGSVGYLQYQWLVPYNVVLLAGGLCKVQGVQWVRGYIQGQVWHQSTEQGRRVAQEKKGCKMKNMQVLSYLFPWIILFLLKTGGFYLQRPKHWKFN